MKKIDEFLIKVDKLCHEYGYEIHPTNGWENNKPNKNGEYKTLYILGKDERKKILFIDGDGICIN